MSKPTEQELKEFANALQLSVKAKVSNVETIGEDSIEIKFDSITETDKGLKRFLQIVEGKWYGENILLIKDAGKIEWPKLNLFLLLTRMKEENISKIIEIDDSLKDIAEKLGIKSANGNIDSVKKCSQIIFAVMEKKKVTIRELAEATGLTQVAISNFKAGGDVRVSTLVKIIKALGMGLKIK